MSFPSITQSRIVLLTLCHQIRCLSSNGRGKTYDKGPGKNYQRKVKKAMKVEIKTSLLEDLKKSEDATKSVKAAIETQQKKHSVNLKGILSEMNIHVRSDEEVRARMGMPSKPFVLPEPAAFPAVKEPVPISFTDGKKLGFFKKPLPSVEVMPDDPWSFCQEDKEKEIKTMLELKPCSNMFEKMIDESPQTWSYPIDNEINPEEENIGFEEHVFMLQHINDDRLPKKGPVRHFMELVATGLSKNPYYSPTEKIQHIEWYKEYFGQFPKEELEMLSDMPVK